MIFTKSKELKAFIQDLKQLSKDELPYCRHYVFAGARGTGKTFLANRIRSLFPKKVVVIDEPIDERLNFTPDGCITIYTTVVPFKRGAYNLIIKHNEMDCPIIKDNSETVNDLVRQAKKLFK